jgi:hypothetical protein
VKKKDNRHINKTKQNKKMTKEKSHVNRVNGLLLILSSISILSISITSGFLPSTDYMSYFYANDSALNDNEIDLENNNETFYASKSKNENQYEDSTNNNGTSDNNNSSSNSSSISTNDNHDNTNNQTTTNMKIVGFADWRYQELAMEWYNSLTELGYNNHVIVAMDEGLYNKITIMNEEKSKSENNSGQNDHNKEIRVEQYYLNQTEGNSVWHHRVKYTKKSISEGTSILLTDVDNVFMSYRDLKTKFYDQDYDIIFGHGMHYPVDVYADKKLLVLAGLIWIKATHNSLDFVNAWESSCNYLKQKGRKIDDQVILNKQLHYNYDMKWDYVLDETDPHDNSTETNMEERVRQHTKDGNDGIIKVEMNGVGRPTAALTSNSSSTSLSPPLKVNILSRDVAWRGRLDGGLITFCPSLEKNWVSMPTVFPYYIVKKYAVRLPMKSKKIMRRFWISYCGANGTHYDTSIEDPMDAAMDLAFKLKFEG